MKPVKPTVVWEKEFRLDQVPQTTLELIQHLEQHNLLISGSMGAGKTTLVSALIRQLGGADPVSSPTFGWVNTYTDNHGRIIAFHFDNYRIEDPSTVRIEELWDYYRQGHRVIMEWPENLTCTQWPEPFQLLELQIIDPNLRILRLYKSNEHPFGNQA